MKRFISLVLLVLLILAFSVNAFALDYNMAVTNWPEWFTGIFDEAISLNVGMIYEVITDINDRQDLYLGDMWADLGHLSTTLDTVYEHMLQQDLAVLEFYETQLQRISAELTHWQNVESSLSYLSNGVDNINQFYSETFFPAFEKWQEDNINQLQYINWNTGDLYSEFYSQFNSLTVPGTAGYSLYMLQQVLATEEDLALRESTADIEGSFQEHFVDGGNGVTTDHFGQVSEIGLRFGELFGSVTAEYGFSTEIFDILTDISVEGPWSWFTETVASDLDTVPVPLVDFEDDEYSNYYDYHYSKIEDWKDGEIND